MTPTIVLHSRLTPAAVAAALRNSIDEERRTLFSFSGYAGDRPVLGEVIGNTLRLQNRRYWRNDFAPHFYGTFRAEPGGTRVEGYFGVSRWVKSFMRFWIAAVIVLGMPITVLALLDGITGSHHMGGDLNTWVAAVVPPGMVLFGILLPKFGRLLGRGEERFILEFLQQTLAAKL